MAASSHAVHFLVFQLAQAAFDLIKGRQCVRRRGMVMRIKQWRGSKMTEVMVLHHLLRWWHGRVRGRIGVHGDGMVARQTSEVDAIGSIGNLVSYRRSSRHDG